jgi:2-oxoglutarate/2-oxoacid ferredoxin oxidoreductase subunit alpha
MATGDLALGQEQGALSTQERVTNDFSINVATVNGSGSQSANSVLLKSIFGMGVPVSGKNLFPSNIAGLPTWFTDPRQQRRLRRPQARLRDSGRAESRDRPRRCAGLPAGGVAIYEENLTRASICSIATTSSSIPCPSTRSRPPSVPSQAAQAGQEHGLRGRRRAVAGHRSWGGESGLRQQFAKKQKVFDLNFGAVKAGFDYAQQNLHQARPVLHRADEPRRPARSSSTATRPAAWARSLPA